METENLKPIISFEDRTKDEYILKLGNYQLVERDGVLYAKRKTIRYPTTASECAHILPLRPYIGFCKELPAKYAVQLKNFSQLLVYRDAYWQLAGEEMELGKPWLPDYSNSSQIKYGISYFNGKIITSLSTLDNIPLAFPTKEMRDAFCDNFHDLIEQCKDFL